MSRKKDIEVIAPLATRLIGVEEREARRQLERLSARELRARRKKIEWAMHPMRDPSFRKLMNGFNEVNKWAGEMLAKIRSRNLPFPPHPTVQ